MRKENIRKPLSAVAMAGIDVSHLLHPAKHFEHPDDVLAADDIGPDEKRAILASWASDIFAIESVPALRLCPGTDKAVSYDEIMEALKTLDADNPLSPAQHPSASLDGSGASRHRALAGRFQRRRRRGSRFLKTRVRFWL